MGEEKAIHRENEKKRKEPGSTYTNTLSYTPATQVFLSCYIMSVSKSGPIFSSFIYLQGLLNNRFSVKLIE